MNKPFADKIYYRFPRFLIAALCAWALFIALANASTNASHHSAVILSYNRIGEDLYPDESLTNAQFAEHLKMLINDGYSVLKVSHIIHALKNNKKLPAKTIGITFDGLYKSAFQKAIPLLIQNNIPFTVFFSSDKADLNTPEFANWKDLKSLQSYNYIDFGLLPASFAPISSLNKAENQRQVNKAIQKARDTLGFQPSLFAYPFGEYTLDYQAFLLRFGFDAIFGQHSGAISSRSNFQALPRFVMTERYGDIERFKLVSTAKSFPAYDIEPQNPLYTNDETPSIGFSVPEAYKDILSQTRCFVSNQGIANTHIIGDYRIEIRPKYALDEQRTRINCTAPAPKSNLSDQSYYWLGLLLNSNRL